MTDLFHEPQPNTRFGHKRKELGMDKYHLLMNFFEKLVADGVDVSNAVELAKQYSNTPELPFAFNDSHARHALKNIGHPVSRTKKAKPSIKNDSPFMALPQASVDQIIYSIVCIRDDLREIDQLKTQVNNHLNLISESLQTSTD